MSLTFAARSAKTLISSRGRPNSFASIAPATLNRSVIVEPMAASSCIDSLVSRCSLRPTKRAGMMNIGAGLRPGEERDRLPLHVSEHLRTQIINEAFADPSCIPALDEGQERVKNRQPGDHAGEAEDDIGSFWQHAPVDDDPEQHRDAYHDHRVQRRGHQEDGQTPSVRSRVSRDPGNCALPDALLRHRRIAREWSHHVGAGTGVHDGATSWRLAFPRLIT